DSCTAAVTLSNEGAGQIVGGTCTDKAGNISAAVSATVNIDKTPPVTLASTVPIPNANGWNNTSVTVSFAGTDNLSGIDSCSSPITFTNQGAGQIATGTCTDKAGNVSDPAKVLVNIDKTPPAISGMPAGGCALWPL